MIGTEVANRHRERGDEVVILTRRARAPDHLQWDPRKGSTERKRFDGCGVLYNFAGAPIADRPWTKARREELWASRVDFTRALLDSFAGVDSPPPVYVGAGGLGRFGDCGDRYIDDDDPPGDGFLAELSMAWEEQHLLAREVIGARACVSRMGMVLSGTGGALPLMVKPYRLGLGGWLGNGKQYTSWISVRDAVSVFVFLADNESCEGAFNGTVPEPIRNKEWCKALGRALHRPVLTHAPKWVLRGALGEFADSLLLASVRAVPRKLTERGFTFEDVDAQTTFESLIAAVEEAR